ncbi:MAG: M55 family metallopeptidase [Bacillota bacterium]
MTTVFISADIEGISGVVHNDHAGPGQGEEYGRARRLMTRQVNAAVSGALEGGARLVIVNDSHGGMRNILIEELDPGARLITGSPKPLSMMQGVEGCDLAFFLGYHTMAGTPGVLGHTYSSRTVHELRISGQPAGETLVNASLAGYYGVPVVLVTGDSGVAAEAAAILHGVRTVAVKEAVGRYAAVCLPLKEADALIREAARDAVRDALGPAGRPEPYRPPSPARFELRFMNTAQADAASMVPGSERLGPLVVAFTDEDYVTAFQAARVMMTVAGSVDSY